MNEPTISVHITQDELGYCIAQLGVALGTDSGTGWTHTGLDGIEALRARLSALYVARFSDMRPGA